MLQLMCVGEIGVYFGVNDIFENMLQFHQSPFLYKKIMTTARLPISPIGVRDAQTRKN